MAVGEPAQRAPMMIASYKWRPSAQRSSPRAEPEQRARYHTPFCRQSTLSGGLTVRPHRAGLTMVRRYAVLCGELRGAVQHDGPTADEQNDVRIEPPAAPLMRDEDGIRGYVHNLAHGLPEHPLYAVPRHHSNSQRHPLHR